MAETKTKTGFIVLQMVEIPREYLRPGVLEELKGRALYEDTTGETIPPEEIYGGDIFEQIAGEVAEGLKMHPDDLKQVEELAEELGEYELIRINTI